MILAVDIGNTNIVLGCCDEGRILFRERVSTSLTATDLEYAVTLRTAVEMNGYDSTQIDGAIISSVVPTITNTVKAAVEKYARVRCKVVGPGMKTGLSIKIDNPAQLGSDLVVDAVAGINEYKAPMIIIDMGTATTLSVIDEGKNYLGGMIMPGIMISHDSLISRTSQLPRIALEEPKKLIGTNTVDCIKGGILYGSAGSIDGICDRIKQEIGRDCTVVATGGLAPVVVPLCKTQITLDEDLLLKGLMLIYNKNNESARTGS
ncbi:MAG: type III pantothenate kinase [Ruminococcus sp.]|nr:type III pantothenate kinase [Ruminococcus sp.]MBQ3936815.1 type III pantothenate kinase [Ruminococcus sp.]